MNQAEAPEQNQEQIARARRAFDGMVQAALRPTLAGLGGKLNPLQELPVTRAEVAVREILSLQGRNPEDGQTPQLMEYPPRLLRSEDFGSGGPGDVAEAFRSALLKIRAAQQQLGIPLGFGFETATKNALRALPGKRPDLASVIGDPSWGGLRNYSAPDEDAVALVTGVSEGNLRIRNNEGVLRRLFGFDGEADCLDFQSRHLMRRAADKLFARYGDELPELTIETLGAPLPESATDSERRAARELSWAVGSARNRVLFLAEHENGLADNAPGSLA